MSISLVTRTALAAIFLLGVVAFGADAPKSGATQIPATQPTDKLDGLRAAMVDTARQYNDEKSRLLVLVRSTDVYHEGAKVVSDRKNELETARDGTDPAAKLKASSAFNKAREALDKIEAAGMADFKDSLDEKAAIARQAAAAFHAAEQAELDAKAQDKAKKSFVKEIREHRVVKGMSYAQATQSMTAAKGQRCERTITDLNDGTKRVTWNCYDVIPGFAGSLGGGRTVVARTTSHLRYTVEAHIGADDIVDAAETTTY